MYNVVFSCWYHLEEAETLSVNKIKVKKTNARTLGASQKMDPRKWLHRFNNMFLKKKKLLRTSTPYFLFSAINHVWERVIGDETHSTVRSKAERL